MDEELFDLCKEVNQRTNWDDGDLYRFNDTGTAVATFGDLGNRKINALVPLYTSDFLLEKLPFDTELKIVMNFGVTRPYKYYASKYVDKDKEIDEWHIADTPLKALLKLTIALHEAGELK